MIIRITALSMVLTGALYPFSQQYNIVQLFVDVLGIAGLYVWSVLSIVCGLLILSNRFDRRYRYLLLSPMLVFVLMTMGLAIQGSSLTAMLYYMSLWAFPVLVELKADYDTNEHQSRAGQLLSNIPITQFMGAPLLLMSVVLWVKPHGSGLEFIYNFLAFTGDPVLFYRVLFGTCGFMLMYPKHSSVALVGLLCLPIWLHGGIFIMTIVTKTFAWGLLPFFVANSLIWVYMIEDKRRWNY